MDHLGIRSCHLVGLSLGGEIALDFSFDSPERVKSFILISTSLGGYSSTVDWSVGDPQAGLEQAKKNWLAHPVFASLANQPEVKAALQAMLADYSGCHWYHQDPRQALQPLAKSRYQEVACPVQLLVGQDDLDYFQAIAAYLQHNILHARLENIPDSGHLACLEQAKLVNMCIENFLQRR